MSRGSGVFTEAIHDCDACEAYVGKALPAIKQAGGRPVVVDHDPQVIEGQWHGTRTVILECDSVAAARTWYDSPAYQAIIGERHGSAEANCVIFAGF